MSLLFSPIKKLIVKAFVSNLQLTNRQLCTKGKSATQSNTPEGFSISTACNYNTCNCPEYSRAVNAIKRWFLLGNRCGFAHLPLPGPVSLEGRAAEGCPGTPCRAGPLTRHRRNPRWGSAQTAPGGSAKRSKSERISSLPAPTHAQRLQDRRPNHEDYSVYIRAKDKWF